MADWSHDVLDPLPFFCNALHSIKSRTVADSAAPHRPRVLDLAFLAAAPLHQFSDHQGAAHVWTFPDDSDPARPKHLVGNFHDGDGVRAIQEQQPIAARARCRLVGGGCDEPSLRGGLSL